MPIFFSAGTGLRVRFVCGCDCQMHPGWLSALVCNYPRFMISTRPSLASINKCVSRFGLSPFACKWNPHSGLHKKWSTHCLCERATRVKYHDNGRNMNVIYSLSHLPIVNSVLAISRTALFFPLLSHWAEVNKSATMANYSWINKTYCRSASQPIAINEFNRFLIESKIIYLNTTIGVNYCLIETVIKTCYVFLLLSKRAKYERAK